MSKEYDSLLNQAKDCALEYLHQIDSLPAFPNEEALQRLQVFDEALPMQGMEASDVIKLLHEFGSAATTAMNSGRYFGFVSGAVLPIANAAEWLTDTWNQNSGLYAMSPIASKLEEICERWLVSLFGLPDDTAMGLVTGSANAMICAFSAAVNELLNRQGYDVKRDGLRNAPPIRIIVGEGAHSTVFSALSLLGFGYNELEIIPADSYGRIKAELVPELDSRTLLILQAGHVCGGSYDPINELCEKANKAGAWVHIDGAFGLWAAASPRHRHLTAGIEKADSWSMDAHKTLNAGYDCGIVLCKSRKALQNAMQSSGSYIAYSEKRDGMLYCTEMSRRARSIALWAVLKHLGAEGVAHLIDGLCENTEYFASELQKAGFIIVNHVFFNQFLVKCSNEEQTKAVLKAVQGSGICWNGSAKWNNEAVMRISVCSYRTTKADIDKSVQQFAAAYKQYKSI